MNASATDLAYSYLDSPVGQLLVAGDADHLHYISFPNGSRKREPSSAWHRDDRLFEEVFRQLQAYFAGELTSFDLPMHFTGTSFQKSVWEALCSIPFGTTISYGVLAASIGKPKASRAVGAANGANPLPIVVPCHRVIGANQTLTGFGGGVETKRYLLDHEQRFSRRSGQQGTLAF